MSRFHSVVVSRISFLVSRKIWKFIFTQKPYTDLGFLVKQRFYIFCNTILKLLKINKDFPEDFQNKSTKFSFFNSKIYCSLNIANKLKWWQMLTRFNTARSTAIHNMNIGEKTNVGRSSWILIIIWFKTCDSTGFDRQVSAKNASHDRDRMAESRNSTIAR